MKSAKELFKELGFKWKETEDVIEYSRSLFKHFAFLQKDKITFYKNDYFRCFYLVGVYDINEDLLQAINQQVNELGWNDTTVKFDVKLDGKKVVEPMKEVE